MAIDHLTKDRFAIGHDLWEGCREKQLPTARDYLFSARPYAPAEPSWRSPPKILVSALLQPGNTKQATNAARPFSEFIRSQQDKLERRGRPRRRSQNTPPLWLDEHRYAAWTLSGHLVTIQDPAPGHGAPKVQLASQKEIRQLKAINRLIPTVIALYKGDSLEKTPTVTRYIWHRDLEAALQAALARALAFEETITEQVAREEAAQAVQEESRPEPRPPVKPLKKSRTHPDGNFTIYQPASEEDDLPPYAIKPPGPPTPVAFESTRKADRYIKKRSNRRHLPADCQVARVMERVRVSPVFRKGFSIPKDPGKLLEMIRKDSRIVKPELHAEWLPRFVQGEDGEWRPQPFQNKGTVRHKNRQRLMAELGETSTGVARAIEESELRKQIDQDDRGNSFDAVIQPAIQVADKAQRGLPQDWQEALGLADCGLAPDWRALAKRSHCPPLSEDGHWLRAPAEYEAHGRVKSHLVELRIDDLVGLLEQFGTIIEFWLIKDSTTAAPRWVLPVRLEQLGSL